MGQCVHVMSRLVHHDLGEHILWQHWDSSLLITEAALRELTF
jgi:hypothetical protein